MIEIYAFFAMFAVQILALSVIFPAQFVKYTRARTAAYPAEALAQLYPGTDPHVATERLLRRFRTAHTVIAVAGFVFLSWMVANAPPLTWRGMTIFPVALLFLQLSPIVFLFVTGMRQIAMLRPVIQERRRKAVLQPRGLFDLISPLRLAVEITIYILFAGLMLYLVHFAADPVPRSLGYPLIGVATAALLAEAAFIYWRLHGRKIPLESQADRMHATGVTAKNSVYGALASVAFMSLSVLLPRFGLESWLPFAMSTFMVMVAVQFCMALKLPPSQPGFLSEVTS